MKMKMKLEGVLKIDMEVDFGENINFSNLDEATEVDSFEGTEINSLSMVDENGNSIFTIEELEKIKEKIKENLIKKLKA